MTCKKYTFGCYTKTNLWNKDQGDVKIKDKARYWWHMPVIPALREAEDQSWSPPEQLSETPAQHIK